MPKPHQQATAKVKNDTRSKRKAEKDMNCCLLADLILSNLQMQIFFHSYISE